MGERQLWDDYDIRGQEYEIWTYDGPNSWVIVDPRLRVEVCETDFYPKLSSNEIDRIAQAVWDWFVD